MKSSLSQIQAAQLRIPNWNSRAVSGQSIVAYVDPPPKLLWREGLIILTFLTAETFSPFSAAVLLGLLAFWSFRNKRSAIQAASLAIPLVSLNPGLVPVQFSLTLFKWAVIICAAMSIGLRSLKQQRFPYWLGALLVFLFVTLLLSIVASNNVQISLFKLLTFSLGLIIALFGFEDPTTAKTYWLHWFYTLHCVILATSSLFILQPVGYSWDGMGFQGIFWHPQTYAVYMVPVTGFLLARLFLGEKISLGNLITMVGGIITLFASGARTAMVALGIGLLASVFCVIVLHRSSRLFLLRQRTIAISLASVIAGCILVGYAGDVLKASALQFVMKRSNQQSKNIGDILTGSFRYSRGMLVDASLRSFEDRPLTGAGFGVDPDGAYWQIERDPFFGFPISAPTETGFIFSSILGQIGILGSLPLLGFFLLYSLPVMRRGSLSINALYWTAFWVNIGEMIFFATGSLGLEMWLIFGLCKKQVESNGEKHHVR